jgi:hypothetical protein
MGAQGGTDSASSGVASWTPTAQNETWVIGPLLPGGGGGT